jgi:hypothetical protein
MYSPVKDNLNMRMNININKITIYGTRKIKKIPQKSDDLSNSK